MKVRYLFLLYSPLIKGVTTKFPLNKGGLRGLFLSTAYCLLLTVFLLGCGGGGSEVGVYDTVTLRITAPDPDIPSDVLSHSKTYGDAEYCTATDTMTIPADTPVEMTIESEVIPNLPSFVTPSAIFIENVTITYTARPSSLGTLSPSLPSRVEVVRQYVDAGESITYPATLVTQEMKGSATLIPLHCFLTIYSYYVTLTFNGTEVISGRQESYSAVVNLRISDYID